MNENIFYDIISSFNGKVEPLLNGNIVSTDRNDYPIREVSDRNYGELHKFFLQDNADIVSLDESYKDFMFALKPSLFKEVVE